MTAATQKAYTPANALESILAMDMDAIARAQQAEFATLAPKTLKTIVLFGAGWLGKHTVHILPRLGREFELYFCDNNASVSGVIEGVPVLTKEDAYRRFGDSALFVVTIFNGEQVIAQLKEAGCKYVMSYATLYRGFPALMPHCALAYPQPIVEDRDEVRAAYALFADDASREEMLRILAWHTTAHYAVSKAGYSKYETYYAPDLVTLHDHERFADCGAFDGDSIREFLRRTDGKIDKIAGFEPIESNFKKLESYRASLTPELAAKMQLHPYALASVAGTIQFCPDGDASSAIQGEQTISVHAAVLDDILADFHPTYLKMDIEGAEVDALTGAQRIMKNDAPLMAITLYHNIRHLWQVPLLIQKANPEYKIYLRRYASDCWETVCYAVGPNRSKR